MSCIKNTEAKCQLCEAPLDITLEKNILALRCSNSCGWGSLPIPVKELPEALSLWRSHTSPENQKKESEEKQKTREIINETYKMLFDKKRKYIEQFELIKPILVHCPYCNILQSVHPKTGLLAQKVECYREDEDYRDIGCSEVFYVNFEINARANVITQEQLIDLSKLLPKEKDAWEEDES